MIKRIKSAVIFFLIFCGMSAHAVNFPSAPNPFHYVNDYTKTLTPSETQLLESKLIAYSKETSSQIAVVLIPSTGNYDIAQYSFELGDKWGIGRKQLNNGVLMLIAINDRKIFIATGQGLEGALPDAFLSRIIRNVITPAFKQGHYMLGIDRGLDYIISASKGEYEAIQEERDWTEYIPILIISLFLIMVLFGEISWRRTPYITPTNNHNGTFQRTQIPRRRNGGYLGNGGFGGGFGGGSGGGFGGGGFGGGGAGGSW